MRLRLCLAAFLIAFSIFCFSWQHARISRAASPSDQAVSHTERIGVNVSEFTDVNAMGFLSPDGVKPWGKIHSDETERLFLAQGDTVYVAFESGGDVKPGDLFTVYSGSDSVAHPLSGGDTGVVISYLGKVMLKSQVNEGLYKGEIVESYCQMQVGDPIFPFTPVSACVQATDPDWGRFKALDAPSIPVVAGKNLYEFLGQYSVAYLAHGLKNGIHRGNLLEILGPPEAAQVPALILGYLLILESRPESATGIVIASKREFPRGTFVRPVNLEKTLHKVAVYYGQNHATFKTGGVLESLFRLKKKVGSDLDLPQALQVIWRLPTCSMQQSP
ncbi:MAG: hypothetical protein R6U38_03225 [Desulfatiglandaceae bacterium]